MLTSWKAATGFLGRRHRRAFSGHERGRTERRKEVGASVLRTLPVSADSDTSATGK